MSDFGENPVGNLTPAQRRQLLAMQASGQLPPSADAMAQGGGMPIPRRVAGNSPQQPGFGVAMPWQDPRFQFASAEGPQGYPPGVLAGVPGVGQGPQGPLGPNGQPAQQDPTFINDCVRKYGALSLRMVGASQLFGGIESHIAKQNGLNMVDMNWTGQHMVAQTAAPPSFFSRVKSFFTGSPAQPGPNMVTERLVLAPGVQNVFSTSEQLSYKNRIELAHKAYWESGSKSAFKTFMARPDSMGKGLWGHVRGSWNNFLYNNMGLKSYFQPSGSVMTTAGNQVLVKGGIQSIAGKILPIMFGYSMLSAFVDGYCSSSKQGGTMAGIMGGTSSLAGEFVKTFVSYKVADMALFGARFLLPRLIPALVPGGLPLTLISLGIMAVAGVASHWGVGKILTGIKDSVLGLFGMGASQAASSTRHAHGRPPVVGPGCAPCGG